eukprot:GHRR01021689.1.p1 GENE.GHRR01021689.1~~GHRR01021689.1.p1  ORF type:complete len:362 (+),score=118.92 GHRR01021689.1:317-1402(+)
MSGHASASNSKPPEVPRLTDICIKVPIVCAGDIGWIESDHVRRVLAGGIRSELEAVEDGTLAGSARDLTWYTWHLWHNIYCSQFRAPTEDELMPLPGDQPVDYAPPKVYFVPAHYRAMLEFREAEAERKKLGAINRLRAGYKAEARERERHSVEYTSKQPPAKRSRLSPHTQQKQAAAGAQRLLGGKPAVKVLTDLGLSKQLLQQGRQAAPSSIRPAAARKLLAKPEIQPSAMACLAKNRPVPASNRLSSQGMSAAESAGSALGRNSSPGALGLAQGRLSSPAAAAVAAGQAGSPKQHQTSSSEEAASEARNSTIRTGMLGQEQASTSLKPLIVTRNVSSRVSRVSTRQEQLARSIRASTR